MLLAACCAAIVIASGPSPDGGWSTLEVGAGAPLQIDRRRIRRDGARVEVWVRVRGDRGTVAAEFEAAGADAASIERVRRALGRSEHRWTFGCDDRSHALTDSIYYADDGTLIRAFRDPRPIRWPVRPDTVGQRMMRAVCGDGDAMAGEDGSVDERSSIDGRGSIDGRIDRDGRGGFDEEHGPDGGAAAASPR